MMMKYMLYDRTHENPGQYGLSCDEAGVFLALDVPLVTRACHSDRLMYEVRSDEELTRLLCEAYGNSPLIASQVAGLKRIAQYMNEGKWVLAKIAAVQLRLPSITDDLALANLLIVEDMLLRKGCRGCQKRKSEGKRWRAYKRDLSNEPRIPAGQTGAGEWTTGSPSGRPPTDPLLIPAQAIAPPMPAPLELPLPPSGLNPPLPLEIPNVGREGFPVNPYPDKPECVEEWAHAMAFCTDQQKKGKFKRGFGGFGKDFASCLRGMVSEACGGNPTA